VTGDATGGRRGDNGDGWVRPRSAAVAAEFPGLRLDWMTVAAPRGRSRSSPPAVVERLGHLANRYRGASVIAMRTKPIPHAYRAFYRQIGLDPDVERIPAERVAVERLLHGGFASVDLITDACLVALLETGVPIWALDADAVDEDGLGIRATTQGDAAWQPGSDYLEPGTLAVVDGRTVHGLLFADPASAAVVRPQTTRVTLFSVAVSGVPAIHVAESLWICADLIDRGYSGE
jgi:DNA/RNA-binding domain of Phe-tRNA-synthetase-like protein